MESARCNRKRCMRALVGTQFQCGHGRNVTAFENDLSRRWLNQSIEQMDKRRLAGTGETHDNENLARLDAETDSVDCHHVSRLLENFVSSETLPYQLGSALGLRPEDFRQVSPWPHTSASFMTELSAQSRGQ